MSNPQRDEFDETTLHCLGAILDLLSKDKALELLARLTKYYEGKKK